MSYLNHQPKKEIEHFLDFAADQLRAIDPKKFNKKTEIIFKEIFKPDKVGLSCAQLANKMTDKIADNREYSEIFYNYEEKPFPGERVRDCIYRICDIASTPRNKDSFISEWLEPKYQEWLNTKDDYWSKIWQWEKTKFTKEEIEPFPCNSNLDLGKPLTPKEKLDLRTFPLPCDLKIKIKCRHNKYLLLLEKGPDNISCLFPSHYAPNYQKFSHQVSYIEIPTEQSSKYQFFPLEKKHHGTEQLLAIFTSNPLELDFLKQGNFQELFKQLDNSELYDLFKQLEKQADAEILKTEFLLQ